jgi:hypothetical protein
MHAGALLHMLTRTRGGTCARRQMPLRAVAPIGSAATRLRRIAPRRIRGGSPCPAPEPGKLPCPASKLQGLQGRAVKCSRRQHVKLRPDEHLTRAVAAGALRASPARVIAGPHCPRPCLIAGPVLLGQYSVPARVAGPGRTEVVLALSSWARPECEHRSGAGHTQRRTNTNYNHAHARACTCAHS